jgi:hypothetical protein
MRDGVAEPRSLEQQITQVLVGLGIISFALKGQPQFRLGLVQPAEVNQNRAEVVVELRHIGIEPDRFPKMRDSLFPSTKGGQRRGDITVAVGSGGIYFERMLDQVDGLTVLSALMDKHAQQAKSFGVVALIGEDRTAHSLGQSRLSRAM